MNKKSFTAVIFFVFVSLFLCAANSDAARKPEIVSHDAKLLQKAISISVQWQSQYPVVLATVSAGKGSKEIELDEYDDNIKDARGFHGEASLVIEIGEIGYLDEEVQYVVQLEDDLGRRSRRVTGQIKLDKAIGVEEGEGEEDRKLVKDFVDSKPKKKVGMIDQVLDVMKRHDTPPVIQDVKINRLGQKKVSFSAKAIDDKGLNKISFKIFNSAGKLVNQQELTELGKLWQGDSETFTLDFGSYKVVEQAIDSANNFSPKKQKDFSLEEPKPKDRKPPWTAASPGGGTYKAAQSVTLECTDDKGGSGCDKTMYSIDESAFKVYTTPLSLPLKDITESKLKFYSVDKTGNKEQVKTASYAIKLSHKIYDDATAAAFLKDLSNSALVTIDFENISTKSEPRTFRGDEYAKKWISFSKPAKEAMKIEPPYNNYSNSNFLSIGNRPYDSPNGDSLNDSLVVKIEGGAKAIGWTFFDVAGGQKDESITFYDRNNNIIYKQNSIPSPKSGLTSFFGIISETPVYKIEIIEASNDGDDVGYDNFIYEPVNKIADKYKDK